MIKRLGIGFVLVAAMVMPASASAELSPSDFKNAAKYCKALRAELGLEAFRAKFGSNENGRNAFGKCVSKQRKARHLLVRVAKRECRAEYAAGPAAFLVKYGEDSAGASSEGRGPEEGTRPDKGARPNADKPDKPRGEARQAFRRCVRLKVKELTEARREAFNTAVSECKAELLADPEAFRAKYGPSRSKRHAFVKCVDQHLADDTGTEQS